uniref:SWI5-dependent HO expression protein 3 n=1 Tax=Anthurium amnicola TaxID=1678845 RepID=A0A1D1Z0F6_9ARAE
MLTMPEIREKKATAGRLPFTEEEMVVDECLGYPTAYAKLCRNAISFDQGPPFAFLPCALQPQESARAKEFNRMFPVVDPGAAPTANSRTYINLLWKQMSHLGNAGFDPSLFRVDPYGNVLYFHADSASPLYWDVDHWFPCSRGGRTVLSNLRLLQWQVCKKKHNKLEFLIPWWDLQLGVSVNQFLCIFASRNSDFRSRAFSFLFLEGGNEELNGLQVVEAHKFPHDFYEKKRQVGLAPAATRCSDASLLKPLTLKSRSVRPSSPSPDNSEGFGKAIIRSWPSISKENDDPNIYCHDNNPHFTIALARDSLREREEAKKKQSEMRGLEDELSDLKRKNEEGRLALQDLEATLIRRRRRVEKCRRLAEAQASYKAQLEKMIRDAMHQSVVYKEHVRLNQAACNTLVARLEAQKVMCDSSEKELLKRFKQRDGLEKQIIPHCDEQGRKRSWTEDTLHEGGDDDSLHEGGDDDSARLSQSSRKKMSKALIVPCCNEPGRKRSWTEDTLYEGGHNDSTRLSHSSRGKMRRAMRKELRVFLEEEQKASEAGLSFDGGIEEIESPIEYVKTANDELAADCKPKRLAIKESQGPHEPMDEEQMTQLGKRNVETWLQMLLEKAEDGHSQGSSPMDTAGPEIHTEDIVHKLNSANPHDEIKFLRLKPLEDKPTFDLKCEEEAASAVMSEKRNLGDLRGKSTCDGAESSRSLDVQGRRVERRGLVRPDSPSTLRRFPSSPLILGVRRGMDCIGKKPLVIGDYDDDGFNKTKGRASR